MPKGPTTSTDTRWAPPLRVAWGQEVAVGADVGTTVGAEMASGSALEAALGSRGRDWTRTGRVCRGGSGVNIDGVRGGTQRKESPGHSSSFIVDDSVCHNAAISRKGYHGREGPDAKNSGAVSMEAIGGRQSQSKRTRGTWLRWRQRTGNVGLQRWWKGMD
jgi:hypothetical protein